MLTLLFGKEHENKKIKDGGNVIVEKGVREKLMDCVLEWCDGVELYEAKSSTRARYL